MVSQTGSFVQAAKRLGLATSVVSKRIKDLEAHLGTLLMNRTTRKVSLTDAGYQYMEQVSRFLDDLEEMEDSLRLQTQNPVGEISMTAPLSFGVRHLGPIISSFLESHPKVSVKVSLNDKQVDLLEEGIDLAIRIGKLSDSTLISKKIFHCRRVVCASPAYFEKHGRPSHPEDLIHHNCFLYTHVSEGRSWPFLVDQKVMHQTIRGRFKSDNGDLLLQAVLAGGGIAHLPGFLVSNLLKEGKLEEVLKDYEDTDFAVYVVYQNKRHLSAKIRLLVDYLSKAFAARFE